MKKIMKRILIAIAALILIGGAAFGIYVSDYYHATEEAEQMAEEAEVLDDNLVFMAEEPIAGLIFYPGGKVEYTAYAPLMKAMAEEGILCVLVEMPCNLAVFDVDAAEGIQEQFPEVEEWYMAGHSLGGSMAAAYLEDNVDEYDGLILLASYSTADLSQSGLRMLSVYGTEDKVLNMEKYEENITNLVQNLHTYTIGGGCHAYFGSYGEQEGDGEAKLPPEEQIEKTAKYVKGFILE